MDEKMRDIDRAEEFCSLFLRTNNSKIVDHFVGQLISTLQSTCCGYYSVISDPFWDL